MTYETAAEAIRRITDEYPAGTKIHFVLTGLKSDPVGYYLEGELNFLLYHDFMGPCLIVWPYNRLFMAGDHRPGHDFFDYTVSSIAGAFSGRRMIAA